MNIVPWVDSTSFQVNSKEMEEPVIIHLTRSMISKEYPAAAGGSTSDATFANIEATRLFY